MNTTAALKVELKNIKYAAFMSEETSCFEGVVYLDGVKSIRVSNAGHGGGDRFHELVPGSRQRLEEYCQTLPPVQSYGMELTMDAELLIGELLEKHLAEKDLTKRLKKKMLFTKTGANGTYAINIPFTPENAAKLRAQNTKVEKILNELPMAEALALFMAPEEK